jgi:hypothetical protein
VIQIEKTAMKTWIIAALILTSISSLAQTKISGKIKDTKGKPIPSVSITLKDTYDGAVTDSSGNFSFTTRETGSHTVDVSSLEYDGYQTTVELNGTPITINAELKEKFNELKAVMVTAGSFEAGDNKRAATVLNAIDIATTAGSNADITAALKTLPGAQQIGNQEGLFVRGGTGEETKQFIDGTLLNNPYYTSVPDIATRGASLLFFSKELYFLPVDIQRSMDRHYLQQSSLNRSIFRRDLLQMRSFRRSFSAEEFSNFQKRKTFRGVLIITM